LCYQVYSQVAIDAVAGTDLVTTPTQQVLRLFTIADKCSICHQLHNVDVCVKIDSGGQGIRLEQGNLLNKREFRRTKKIEGRGREEGGTTTFWIII